MKELVIVSKKHSIVAVETKFGVVKEEKFRSRVSLVRNYLLHLVPSIISKDLYNYYARSLQLLNTFIFRSSRMNLARHYAYVSCLMSFSLSFQLSHTNSKAAVKAFGPSIRRVARSRSAATRLFGG